MVSTVTPTTVPTGAGRLHVRTTGSGPPALLWHSLLVDSGQWDRVLGTLATRRTLVVVDGPGHGRSGPPPRGSGFDACADAAVDVLDALAVDGPVDWVGNAWGGHVGYAFAARHPGRCRTLTAVAAPHTPLPPAQHRRIALLVALYRVLGPRPLTRPVVETLLAGATRDRDAEAVRIVRDAFRRGHRTGMHRVMTAMMLQRPDLSETLARITAPALLVTGEHDPTWSPSRARAAAGLPAHGDAAVVDGSGHLPPLENPSAFSELVLRFWADA